MRSLLIPACGWLLAGAAHAQTNWQQISAYNDGITQRIQEQQRFSSEMDAIHHQQQMADGGAGYASAPPSAEWIAEQMAKANDNALRARDYVGVLAYDVEALRWSWQVDADSAGRALYDLRKECPESRCPLVAVFHNTCLAAARSSTHQYFWGDGDKPKRAGAAALKACAAQTGERCVAEEPLAMCTGYRYLDSPDKMSRFRRGGLIGVFVPSAAGIAASKPASVAWNPTLQLFQAMPTTAQQTLEARAGALGKTPPWGAFGLSPSKSTLSFAWSLTEAGAGAMAKQQCRAADCLVALSFQGPTCIASGTGTNAAGQGMFFLQKGADQAAADAAMDRECEKAGARCAPQKQRFCFPAL